MDPNQIRNLEFYAYNETILNPIALIFTLIMGILILVMERKYIIIPMMAVVCYIPYIQRIVIGGLDFEMVRVLLLFFVLRMIMRRDKLDIMHNSIDKAYYIYTVAGSIAYIFLWKTGGAVVNRLGFMFNAFGLYFLIRYSVRDLEDAQRIIRTLVLFSLPIACAMVIEQVTGRNYFSVFGGVPEFTVMREGKLRSQGAFSHAILAGSFGGALIPLAWAYYFTDVKNRKLALAGVLAGFIIVYTSSSSGPIMTLGGGLVAIFFYRFRKHMQTVRRLIVLALVVIQLSMKGPIYSLIWRLTFVGGSTGYFRYMLIDAAVKRFREWFLFGIKTTMYWGFGLQDVTNMYILVGTNGGVLALIFFVVMIVRTFKAAGKTRLKLEMDEKSQKIIWGLAANLFAHCVSFIGVSYFDNTIFFYYLTIGTISGLYMNYVENKNTTAQAPVPLWQSAGAGI